MVSPHNLLSLKVEKAVGYRRVSGRSQADNFSLRSQDGDVREHCDRENLILDRVFTDVGSGLSTKQRPEFLHLLEYALDPANGIKHVVFYDLDRFTRNIEEFFIYTKDLLRAGITLHLALDNEKFDYNSEEKWYQRLIAAQAESKKISRRTKRGQREAIKLGYHIGAVPWAYKLAHDAHDLNQPDQPEEEGEEKKKIECGWLVPDPDKWEDCLTFWRLASDNNTPLQIAKYMNQHNIPTSSGGLWTDEAARYIMRNRTYLGEGFRGVHPRSRLPGPKDNAPPIIEKNVHEAAVSYEDFERINEGIDSRHISQGPIRAHSSPNPLSPRVKCGECKAKGLDSTLEIHRQNGIASLRCSRKKKMGAETCIFKGIRLDDIIHAVSGRLRNHFLTEENLESLVDKVVESSKAYLEQQMRGESGIKAKLNIVEGEIENTGKVLIAAGDRAENLHYLIGKLEKFELEKQDLQKQLDLNAEASKEALLFLNDREGIIETALDLKTLTDPEDPEAIRELFQIFIERVEIFEDRHGDIHYTLPVQSAGPEGTPGRETIYFEKKTRSKAAKSCGLEGFTGTVRTHIQGAGRIRQAAQLLTTAVNDAPAVTGTAQSASITEGEYGPPRNAPDPAPMAVGIAYISGRKTREQHGHPRSPSSRDMNEDAEYALGPTSFHSLREAQELADVL